MIDCVTWETSHLFGDALISQHRLRHRVFIERQKWDLRTHNGLEFDQFDNPSTVYFIWRDHMLEARGVSRITPTMCPYMLQTIWPDLVTEEPLPAEPCVWEGSRIGIDKAVEPALRQRIFGEIVCAYLEFGLLHRIERYLVLMPFFTVKRTLAHLGCTSRIVGPVRKMGNIKAVAASMDVSWDILRTVRERSGIEGTVLHFGDRSEEKKAA